MAKKNRKHIIARIKELRAQGMTRHDAGQQAYREAGLGKSKARGTGSGKRGGHGVAYREI